MRYIINHFSFKLLITKAFRFLIGSNKYIVTLDFSVFYAYPATHA